jgi:hypothetical protein
MQWYSLKSPTNRRRRSIKMPVQVIEVSADARPWLDSSPAALQRTHVKISLLLLWPLGDDVGRFVIGQSATCVIVAKTPTPTFAHSLRHDLFSLPQPRRFSHQVISACTTVLAALFPPVVHAVVSRFSTFLVSRFLLANTPTIAASLLPLLRPDLKQHTTTAR